MPDVFVNIPDVRVPEHTWIVNTMLRTYLGLDVSISPHEQRSIVIHDSVGNSRLELPSILLTESDDDWEASSAIPQSVPYWLDQSRLSWKVPEQDVPIPILYIEVDPGKIVEEEHKVQLPWDLFGSAYFMLTRLEEVLLEDADVHGRFPASASLAVKEGFERIPVVNAWGEILWGAVQYLWPGLQRKQHTYRAIVSHDVDWPLVSNRLPLRQILKSSAGDIIARKSPGTALRRFVGATVPERYRPRINPGNSFDFIMRESERNGISSAFYFIPENTAGQIDGTYTLDMPFVGQLLHEIHTRGHEIGIHPGYNTYQSAERVVSAFTALRQATDSLGIQQHEWGGRQHYLRWNAKETWRHWESAGLSYDSTVGYAETVGFRAGACFDYQVFDVVERRELLLIERPLIVMEGALFKSTSPVNMAVGDDMGTEVVSELADTVHGYGGNFTLLWHNSTLITPQQQRLYSRVMAKINF